MATFGSGLVPSHIAARGGIVQLTKSLAIELAPHNIQVNAIGYFEPKTPVRRSFDSRRSLTANSCLRPRV
jgi:NAD(P)-dependent dehydrogenase (short-subunit alcohol dehydrogenase family)